MDERWRILVVDDDKDVLDLIRMKLTEEYDVLCIDQATEVSHAVDLFEPDLIILDIMLPKISGYQVAEYLKRNPSSAKTPVCFLSAKSSARDLKYGYQLGAALYLTKPFQPERLVKNMKLLFERTPPPRRPKRFPIDQVNERLQLEGAYHVATSGAETVIPKAPKREKPAPATPPPASGATAVAEPEDDDDNRPRTHWVD